MADESGRAQPITLNTAIMLVTMIAGLAGTWSIMGERIANLVAVTHDLKARNDNISGRLFQVERENATLEVRLENLRETVGELRQRR